MKYLIRYVIDDQTVEKIYDLNVDYTMSAARIFSAAKTVLDRKLGSVYTLLRVKSYSPPKSQTGASPKRRRSA